MLVYAKFFVNSPQRYFFFRSVILDNNVEFNLKNGNEIDLDFSFDQFSPNPSFVSPFVMQFVCTPSENPIEWFEGWINANSIAASPSANILKDSLNLAGQAKLSSSQNTFIRNQGQNSEFNILFEPFGNNCDASCTTSL